jgi:hypothetical protein
MIVFFLLSGCDRVKDTANATENAARDSDSSNANTVYDNNESDLDTENTDIEDTDTSVYGIIAKDEIDTGNPCQSILDLTIPDAPIAKLMDGCGGTVNITVSGLSSFLFEDSEFATNITEDSATFLVWETACPDDSTGFMGNIHEDLGSYWFAGCEGAVDWAGESFFFALGVYGYQGPGNYTAYNLVEDGTSISWGTTKGFIFHWNSEEEVTKLDVVFDEASACAITIFDHPYTGQMECNAALFINEEEQAGRVQISACWRAFGYTREEEVCEGGC